MPGRLKIDLRSKVGMERLTDDEGFTPGWYWSTLDHRAHLCLAVQLPRLVSRYERKRLTGLRLRACASAILIFFKAFVQGFAQSAKLGLRGSPFRRDSRTDGKRAAKARRE